MIHIEILPDTTAGYTWHVREAPGGTDAPLGTILARGESCFNLDTARRIVKRLFGGSTAPEAVDVTIRYRNGTTEQEWIR